MWTYSIQYFTDVDDKIIKRSKEEGISAREVAEKYINKFRIDESGLNVKKATYNPRVTENISEIINMIKTLVDKGNAYVIDGNVYFDTKSFKK
jgi:cysteinyl-tRNA synthetase